MTPFHLTAPDHEPMGDDPVLYQIRVSGHLGPTLLPDAAALYGVLAEIEALGLDLLEVRKIRPH